MSPWNNISFIPLLDSSLCNPTALNTHWFWGPESHPSAAKSNKWPRFWRKLLVLYCQTLRGLSWPAASSFVNQLFMLNRLSFWSETNMRGCLHFVHVEAVWLMFTSGQWLLISAKWQVETAGKVKLIRSWFTKVLSCNVEYFYEKQSCQKSASTTNPATLLEKQKNNCFIDNLQTRSKCCQIKIFFQNQQFKKTGHRT